MEGYCHSCKKQVQGVKKPWSWLCFLAWIPTMGIIYIIYHACKKKNKCPICGLTVLKEHIKD